MKTYLSLLIIATGQFLLSCQNDADEKNATNTNDPKNTEGTVIKEENEDLTHEQECLNAVSISTISNTRHYSGTLDEHPIVMSFTRKDDEVTGMYLYTNNGVSFPLYGYKEDHLITLYRYKDEEIRETFSLEDEGEFAEGSWKKEEDVKSVHLDKKLWNDSQLEEFQDILMKEISLLDLTFYDPDDFSSLELDNGTLTVKMFDGGTTGSYEMIDTYHLLDIANNGEVTFLHILTENTSTWLSMEDIEAGMTEDDITDENYHNISIELIKSHNGIRTMTDSKSLEGKSDVKTYLIENNVVFYHDGTTNVIGWSGSSKELQTIK